MDTTSGVLTHILYMLAAHPDVQERLRAEILAKRAAVDGEQFSYDQLGEMPLLDAVCRETLRMQVHENISASICANDIPRYAGIHLSCSSLGRQSLLLSRSCCQGVILIRFCVAPPKTLYSHSLRHCAGATVP